MPERINAGHVLSLVGALVLLVSLFLTWYEPDQSAWTAFEIIDLLLAGLALTAILAAAPFRITAAGTPSRLPVPSRWLPAIGIATLVLVVAALLNHPPSAIDRSHEAGSWTGLAGAILMAAGGMLSSARVSLVITVRSGDSPARPTGAAAPTEPLRDEGATRPFPEEER